MTFEKTLVIAASAFAMLCMPLLVTDNMATKSNRSEPQSVNKTAGDIEAAKKTIEKLKNQFRIEKGEDEFDEFATQITYTHKNYPEAKLPSLSVPVFKVYVSSDTDIDIIIASVSYQKINPKRILVKIDDKITTFTASPATVNKFSTYGSTGLDLTVYSLFPDSLSLIRLIASHPKKEIRIRLSGNENLDFSLPTEYHQAICETLELYNALQIVKKSESQELQER